MSSSRHRCQYCAHTTNKRVNLFRHLIKRHSEYLPFNCGTCGKPFSCRNELLEHEKYAHSEQVKKDKVFTLYSLDTSSSDSESDEEANMEASKTNHKPLSRKTSNRHFRCWKCGEGRSNSIALNNHIMTDHYNMKNYRCEFCNMGFVKTWNLEKHMEEIHGQTLSYRCPYCDIPFKSKTLLFNHYRCNHPDDPITRYFRDTNSKTLRGYVSSLVMGGAMASFSVYVPVVTRCGGEISEKAAHYSKAVKAENIASILSILGSSSKEKPVSNWVEYPSVKLNADTTTPDNVSYSPVDESELDIKLGVAYSCAPSSMHSAEATVAQVSIKEEPAGTETCEDLEFCEVKSEPVEFEEAVDFPIDHEIEVFDEYDSGLSVDANSAVNAMVAVREPTTDNRFDREFNHYIDFTENHISYGEASLCDEEMLTVRTRRKRVAGDGSYKPSYDVLEVFKDETISAQRKVDGNDWDEKDNRVEGVVMPTSGNDCGLTSAAKYQRCDIMYTAPILKALLTDKHGAKDETYWKKQGSALRALAVKMNLALANIENQYTTVDDEPPIRKNVVTGRRIAVLPKYTRWVTPRTVQIIEQSAARKEVRCVRCGWLSKNPQRANEHFRQHFVRCYCRCGFSSQSRDTVYDHQLSLDLMKDAIHFERTGYIYIVDKGGYAALCRYAKWNDPEPFPDVCVPSFDGKRNKRRNHYRRNRPVSRNEALNRYRGDMPRDERVDNSSVDTDLATSCKDQHNRNVEETVETPPFGFYSGCMNARKIPGIDEYTPQTKPCLVEKHGGDDVDIEVIEDDIHLKKQNSITNSPVPVQAHPSVLENLALAAMANRHTTIDDEPPIRKSEVSGRRMGADAKYTRWITPQTLQIIEQSAAGKETTCGECGFTSKNPRQASIHFRQHFVICYCKCGYSSQSRDTVWDHQQSLDVKDDPVHYEKTGYIYSVDREGYAAFCRYVKWTNPEPFPDICVPSFDGQGNVKRVRPALKNKTFQGGPGDMSRDERVDNASVDTNLATNCKDERNRGDTTPSCDTEMPVRKKRRCARTSNIYTLANEEKEISQDQIFPTHMEGYDFNMAKQGNHCEEKHWSVGERLGTPVSSCYTDRMSMEQSPGICEPTSQMKELSIEKHGDDVNIKVIEDDPHLKKQSSPTNSPVPVQAHPSELDNLALAAKANQHTTIDDEPPIRKSEVFGRRMGADVKYTRWITPQTLQIIEQSAARKETTCGECGLTSRNPRQASEHFRQHFVICCCKCGFSSQSRDTVYDHQRCLDEKDDPVHYEKTGYIYSVDREGYAALCRYVKWTNPEPFPDVCVPSFDGQGKRKHKGYVRRDEELKGDAASSVDTNLAINYKDKHNRNEEERLGTPASEFSSDCMYVEEYSGTRQHASHTKQLSIEEHGDESVDIIVETNRNTQNSSPTPQHSTKLEDMALAAMANQHTTIDDEPPIDRCTITGKRIPAYFDYTRWVTPRTLKMIEQTLKKKQLTCEECGLTLWELRQVSEHYRQHFVRYYCRCGFSSQSRDRVHDHQQSLDAKKDPVHYEKTGYIYQVDRAGYAALCRYAKWNDPEPFPKVCVPTFDKDGNIKRRITVPRKRELKEHPERNAYMRDEKVDDSSLVDLNRAMNAVAAVNEELSTDQRCNSKVGITANHHEVEDGKVRREAPRIDSGRISGRSVNIENNQDENRWSSQSSSRSYLAPVQAQPRELSELSCADRMNQNTTMDDEPPIRMNKDTGRRIPASSKYTNWITPRTIEIIKQSAIKGQLTCVECGLSMKNPQIANIHLRQHFVRCYCRCGFSSQSPYTVYDHQHYLDVKNNPVHYGKTGYIYSVDKEGYAALCRYVKWNNPEPFPDVCVPSLDEQGIKRLRPDWQNKDGSAGDMASAREGAEGVSSSPVDAHPAVNAMDTVSGQSSICKSAGIVDTDNRQSYRSERRRSAIASPEIDSGLMSEIKVEVKDSDDDTHQKKQNSPTSCFVPVQAHPEALSLANKANQHTTIDNEPPVCISNRSGKRMAPPAEYTSWITPRTLQLIRQAVINRQETCMECGYTSKNLRQADIHYRQHFVRRYCRCGYSSQSRDSVHSHQQSLDVKDDPIHYKKTGYIYSADREGYAALCRYAKWSNPEPFPDVCVPCVIQGWPRRAQRSGCRNEDAKAADRSIEQNVDTFYEGTDVAGVNTVATVNKESFTYSRSHIKVGITHNHQRYSPSDEEVMSAGSRCQSVSSHSASVSLDDEQRVSADSVVPVHMDITDFNIGKEQNSDEKNNRGEEGKSTIAAPEIGSGLMSGLHVEVKDSDDGTHRKKWHSPRSYVVPVQAGPGEVDELALAAKANQYTTIDDEPPIRRSEVTGKRIHTPLEYTRWITPRTLQIIEQSAARKEVTCGECGFTSTNPQRAKEHYCQHFVRCYCRCGYSSQSRATVWVHQHYFDAKKDPVHYEKTGYIYSVDREGYAALCRYVKWNNPEPFPDVCVPCLDGKGIVRRKHISTTKELREHPGDIILGQDAYTSDEDVGSLSVDTNPAVNAVATVTEEPLHNRSHIKVEITDNDQTGEEETSMIAAAEVDSGSMLGLKVEVKESADETHWNMQNSPSSNSAPAQVDTADMSLAAGANLHPTIDDEPPIRKSKVTGRRISALPVYTSWVTPRIQQIIRQSAARKEVTCEECGFRSKNPRQAKKHFCQHFLRCYCRCGFSSQSRHTVYDHQLSLDVKTDSLHYEKTGYIYSVDREGYAALCRYVKWNNPEPFPDVCSPSLDEQGIKEASPDLRYQGDLVHTTIGTRQSAEELKGDRADSSLQFHGRMSEEVANSSVHEDPSIDHGSNSKSDITDSYLSNGRDYFSSEEVMPAKRRCQSVSSHTSSVPSDGKQRFSKDKVNPVHMNADDFWVIKDDKWCYEGNKRNEALASGGRMNRAWANVKNQHTTIDDEPPIRKNEVTGRRLKADVKYTRWITYQTLQKIEESAVRKEATCGECGLTSTSPRQTKIHFRQHFVRCYCRCGYSSQSRDTVWDHQQSLDAKQDPIHYEKTGYIYSVDRESYAAFCRYAKWNNPEPFPVICVPSLDGQGRKRMGFNWGNVVELQQPTSDNTINQEDLIHDKDIDSPPVNNNPAVATLDEELLTGHRSNINADNHQSDGKYPPSDEEVMPTRKLCQFVSNHSSAVSLDDEQEVNGDKTIPVHMEVDDFHMEKEKNCDEKNIRGKDGKSTALDINVEVKDSVDDTHHKKQNSPSSCSVPVQVHAEELSLANKANQHTTIDNEPPIRLSNRTGKRIAPPPEYTSWVTPRILDIIKQSAVKRELTCVECGLTSYNPRQATIHYRQHFVRYYCRCGHSSQSRDSVWDHQRTRDAKKDAEHYEKTGYIYSVDREGYAALCRYVKWNNPKPFPDVCIPSFDEQGKMRLRPYWQKKDDSVDDMASARQGAKAVNAVAVKSEELSTDYRCNSNLENTDNHERYSPSDEEVMSVRNRCQSVSSHSASVSLDDEQGVSGDRVVPVHVVEADDFNTEKGQSFCENNDRDPL